MQKNRVFHPSRTMKAAILKKYGNPEGFAVKQVPAPRRRSGQLLIYNRASSVNPIDTIVRKGSMRLISGLFGHPILGSDFSGTVIESESEMFDVGCDVFGFRSAMRGGAYAEQVVVSEDQVALKPARLSFTEAGVMPLVASTAWQGLVEAGEIKPSDHVLITGCTGGVGTMAVQIAKSFGSEVTGVCSEKHMGFARMLGCDHVINYELEPIQADHQYDLFFDAAGKYTLSDFRESLKEDAMFVSTRGGVKDFSSGVQAVTDLLSGRMKVVRVKPSTIDLLSIMELVDDQKLKPYVARVFPLEQVASAHHMMEEESFIGKIAIEISSEGDS